MTEPWLSVKELAAHFGVHEDTIRRQIQRGKLAAKRIGRLLRVAPDEVRKYEAENLHTVAETNAPEHKQMH